MKIHASVGTAPKRLWSGNRASRGPRHGNAKAQTPAANIDTNMAEAVAKYNEGLRAPLTTQTGPSPKAKVHRVEWAKVMAGDPVEINPSVGSGYRVMTVQEWAARWKRNDDFPECMTCGSINTREHYFTQTWCRGRKLWESETLCLDCFSFSFRGYKDPDFKTPEQWEKLHWEQLAGSQATLQSA